MVIKAVFFDFDGTISDSYAVVFRSLVRALKESGHRFDKRKLKGLLGVRAERLLRELVLDEPSAKKVRKIFYGYLSKAVSSQGIQSCVSLKPLWEMKESGMPLLVVSNSHSSFLRASIKALNIGGLFKRVYGAEKFDVAANGSKDGMLQALFKGMKIKPSEAVYVGDRFSDVEFARKVGCVAVAVHNSCSWSTLERVKKEKPDYIVRDFYGLRKVLRELNS